MAIINGTSGNDTITGTADNDVITGGAGNDQIDGGGGVDVVVYSGNIADYDISTVNGVTFVKDRLHRDTGWDGNDKLINVERLQFANGHILFTPDKAPLPAAASTAVTEDTALTAAGNLLTNASDPDGDALSVTSLSFGNGPEVADGSVGLTGAYGKLTWGAAGSFTYALDNASAKVQALAAGQTATEVFTYTVSDGWGGTATQKLTVIINGSNDAPSILSAQTTASASITQGTGGTALHQASGVVSFADVDLADSHVMSVTPQGQGYIGALTLGAKAGSTGSGTGSVGWNFTVSDQDMQALAGNTVTETYNVIIDDGHGGTVIEPISVTLKGQLFKPISADDVYTLPHQSLTLNAQNLAPAQDPSGHTRDPDQTFTVDAAHGVLANDTHDGSTTAQMVNGPSHGVLTFNPDGSFSYTPDFRYVGTDSFTYHATNAYGTSADAAVTLSVSPADLTINAPARASVWGGPGNDTITITGPEASAWSGGGNDTINDTGNVGYIAGGSGADAVNVAGSGNWITMGAGNDTLTVAGDANYIWGNYAAPYLGSKETPAVSNPGDKQFTITGQANNLHTGEGNNSVTINATYSVISSQSNNLYMGNGNNTVHLNGYNTVAFVGNGNNSIAVNGNSVQVDVGNGSNNIDLSGDPTLTANRISLGSGANTIAVHGGVSGGDNIYHFKSGMDHVVIQGATAPVTQIVEGYGLELVFGSGHVALIGLTAPLPSTDYSLI